MTTSINPSKPGSEQPATVSAPPTEPRSGLSELVIPALLVVLAIFLIIGTINMDLPPSVQVPGPTFFPIVVICLLLLMAVLSTVQILLARSARRRDFEKGLTGSGAELDAALAADADGDELTEIPPDVPPGREPWPAGAVSDWRALGTVLGSLILFIALLRPAGWILAAALLFWGVSYALGARRPLFDLSVALLMSAAIQLIFGSALGLNLPAGFLEGVL